MATDRRFALPSFEESQQLRQAEDIVHGNLVNMEITELLAELRVRYGKLSGLEKSLFKLRAVLLAMRERRVCAAPLAAAAGAQKSAVKDGTSTAEAIRIPGNTTLYRDNTKVSAKQDTSVPLFRTVEMDFAPPAAVELAGSFLLRSVCRPRCTIDIVVEMPAECFLPKDILDHRYADKRLLYLSVLAKGLEESGNGQFSDVSIVGFREGDENSKAVLLVKPRSSYEVSQLMNKKKRKGKRKSKSTGKSTDAEETSKYNRHERAFSFRIIPCLHKSTFDSRKLGPTFGNLRKHRSSATERLPTPRYNCSILEDMYILRHLRGLYRVAKGDDHLPPCPSFLDACILLKAWARRRGMLDAPDTFNGFLLSVLLAQLVNSRVVNRNANPRQMFSSFMSYVSQHDFGRSGMILDFMSNKSDGEFQSSSDSDSSFESDASDDDRVSPLSNSMTSKYLNKQGGVLEKKNMVSEQLSAHDVVMIDPGTGLNVASRVSLNAYRELRHQAGLASSYLGKDTGGAMDTFDPLFLMGSEDSSQVFTRLTSPRGSSMSSFWHRFDQYAIVYPRKTLLKNVVARASWNSTNTLQHISDIVERALGDRSKLVRVVWDSRVSISSMNGKKKEAAGSMLRPAVVGVLLDPQKMGRLLDRGPHADDNDAATKFRTFWGEKSELRRFRDGSILEATFWGEKLSPLTGKKFKRAAHQIPGDIMEFAILRHVHAAKRCCVLGQSQVDRWLDLPKELVPAPVVSSSKKKRKRSTREEVGMDETGVDARVHAVQAALTSLSAGLHAISDRLPLSFDSLQCTHSAANYTQPYQSTFNPRECYQSERKSRFTQYPISVVLTFESSSRWPDDLVAIQHVKAALLAEIAKQLRHPKADSTVREKCAGANMACVENVVGDCGGTKVLDVIYDHHLFRLEVFCPRELDLVRMAARGEPIIVSGRRKIIQVEVHDRINYTTGKLIELKGPRARQMLRDIRGRTIVRPAHHAAMHALHMYNTSFGPAVRLVKKWLHRMMLSQAFLPEAVELLVASLYCEPNCRPFVPPASATTAFLRFLRLISTFDWERDALCVDPTKFSQSYKGFLNNKDGGRGEEEDEVDSREVQLAKIDAAARVRAEKSFENARKGGKIAQSSPPMFLVSHLDEDRSMTKDSERQAEKDRVSNANVGSSVVMKRQDRDTGKQAAEWCPSFTSINQPSSLELKRTVALAQHAREVLIRKPEDLETWADIFSSPPKEDYDAVLVLNTEWLHKIGEGTAVEVHGTGPSAPNKRNKSPMKRGRLLAPKGSSKFVNLNKAGIMQNTTTSGALEDIIVGFSPLGALMEKLQSAFSHLAQFFVDEQTGEYIGVVFRDGLFSTTSPFTAAGSRFAVPQKTGVRMVDISYDRDVMLKEMRAIGGDLVLTVNDNARNE